MSRDALDFWYGLTPDGEQIGVEHSAMMEWAFNHDCQISVGWSHDMTVGVGCPAMNKIPTGTRFARTLQACVNKEWWDIAEAFAYKDGNQFCVLIGDDIQSGIAGFGNTPAEAVAALRGELKPAIPPEAGKETK